MSLVSRVAGGEYRLVFLSDGLCPNSHGLQLTEENDLPGPSTVIVIVNSLGMSYFSIGTYTRARTIAIFVVIMIG